jgi:hypothetical protein
MPDASAISFWCNFLSILSNLILFPMSAAFVNLSSQIQENSSQSIPTAIQNQVHSTVISGTVAIYFPDVSAKGYQGVTKVSNTMRMELMDQNAIHN